MPVCHIAALEFEHNKMDYKCFLCKIEFENIKLCFAHLKQAHFIVDNSQSIECIVNHPEEFKCNKSYNTYNGLRSHVKICVQERRQPNQHYLVPNVRYEISTYYFCSIMTFFSQVDAS